MAASMLMGCMQDLETTVQAASPEPTTDAAPTTEPKPEPEVTQSDTRLAEAPEGFKIPAEYTAATLSGVEPTVYMFSDSTGQTQFRAYAEYDILEDGVVTETVQGFAAIEIAAPAEEDAKFKLTSNPSGLVLVDLDAEDYGVAVKADIFAEAVPLGYISQFADNSDIPFVLCFDDIYGEKQYRVPAAFGAVEAHPESGNSADEEKTDEESGENADENITEGFYAADADGNVLPGALLTDYEVEIYYILAEGSEPVEKPDANLPAVYVVIGNAKYPVHPAIVIEEEPDPDNDETKTTGEKTSGNTSASGGNASTVNPPSQNSVGVVSPTPAPESGGNGGTPAPENTNGGGNTDAPVGGEAITAPTPAPEPAPTPTPAPEGYHDDGMASSVLSMINSERQAAGLEPASVGGKNARGRAKELANSFGHAGNGDECISQTSASAGAIVSAFKGSSGHWNALMSPTAYCLTVGVYIQNGTAYCCIKIG